MATQRAIPFSTRGAPSSRPSRPHSKRQQGHGTASKSVNKSSQTFDDSDEDVMAAGFLNYCTFCESQITHPSPSILYCSESCRKKDNNKVLSYDNNLMADTSSTLALSSTPTSFTSILQPRDIVPQHSPTALHRNRFSSYSVNSEAEQDETYSDDDEVSSEIRRPTLSYRGSEADRYLRQFRAKDASSDQMSTTPRPRYNRSSGSLANMSYAPSLSHSSSFSDAMSFPYTPSTRPLPSRTNPFSSSYGPKTSDLVNPFAPTPLTTTSMSLQHTAYATRVSARSSTYGSLDDDDGDGEQMRYGKTVISQSPAAGSLKQLFRFTDMQASPGR